MMGLGPAQARAHGPMPIGPIWALAHWARVRPGPGPKGPCPLGPGPARAHGALPIGPGSGPGPGPWALAHWARGPWPIGISVGPKRSIFQKVWEWLPLVWKMSGYLGGVFLSYLEPPNSHIIKNPKNVQQNNKCCLNQVG